LTVQLTGSPGGSRFSPLNIPQWTYWGEAAIPKEYVLRQWTEWFEFVDFIDDANGSLQSVVVVRKSASINYGDRQTG
jgi:hypothetical protein